MGKKLFIGILLFLASLAAATEMSAAVLSAKCMTEAPEGQTPRKLPLPTKEGRINVLILGDGYRNADCADFKLAVQHAQAELFALPQLAAYQGLFHFDYWLEASVEAGAGVAVCSDPKDENKTRIVKNNVYGSEYCTDGAAMRNLAPKFTKVRDSARTIMPGVDLIIVLVNETKFGGSGEPVSPGDKEYGNILTAAAGYSQLRYLIGHEFGHAFIKLGDEYDDGGAGADLCKDNPPAGEYPCEPNITRIKEKDAAPWLVKWSPMYGVRGLWNLLVRNPPYEGAKYVKQGYFRPAESCMMRTFEYFCPVCDQEYAFKVRRKIPVVVGVVPDAGGVEIPLGQSREFTITGGESTRGLRYTWKRNGQALQQSSNKYLFPATAPGTYLLSVKVEDDSPTINADMAKTRGIVTSREISWTIHVATKAEATATDANLAEQAISIPLPSGTKKVSVDYTVTSAAAHPEDEYTITVGYLQPAELQSAKPIIDIHKKLPTATTISQTASGTVDISKGDVVLYLRVTAKNGETEFFAPLRVSATLKLGDTPGGDPCAADPPPVGCPIPFAIRSARVMHVGEEDSFYRTNGAHNYFSIPRLELLNHPRWMELELQLPKTWTKLRALATVEDASGKQIVVANNVEYGPDRGFKRWTHSTRDLWRLRVSHNTEPKPQLADADLRHQIRYNVRFFVTLADGRTAEAGTVVDSVDTVHSLYALWRAPFPSQKFFNRYADMRWCSLATYKWLQQNEALLPKLGDITAEHELTFQDGYSHPHGTSFEADMFNGVITADPDASAYETFVNRLKQAFGGSKTTPAQQQAARDQLADTIQKFRARVDALLEQEVVEAIKLPAGNSSCRTPYPELPQYFIQTILETGKLTSTAGATLDLTSDPRVGPKWLLRPNKVAYECSTVFGDIYLDRCRLGETPGPCVTGRTILKRIGIVAQPADQTIMPKTSATLTVLVEGDEPRFQWYEGAAGNYDRPIPDSDKPSILVRPEGTTQYWVYVRGAQGYAISRTAQITVCSTAKIVESPKGRKITRGDEIELAVTASGSEPLTYKWFANDREIEGAGGRIIRVAPTETTVYRARVSNACGTMDSAAARIEVCVPVGVAASPQSKTVVNGSSTPMRVAASGTGPVRAQWYRAYPNEEPQAIEETRFEWTLTPTRTARYFAVLSNDCGNAPSAEALITFCIPPGVAVSPVGTTINSGESIHLTVETTGTDLLYQWYEGAEGNREKPLTGETKPRLDLEPQKSTSYWVEVRNGCGIATSRAAEITVIPPCTTVSIETPPASAAIYDDGSAELFVTVAGTLPVTYQWYEGTDDAKPMTEETSARVLVSPRTTTWYWVRVMNACGQKSSTPVQVHVTRRCTPPTVVTQPQAPPSAVDAGDEVRLAVGVSGTQPVSVQWYTIAGGVERALDSETDVILLAHPTESADYFARIANDCGTDRSATVHVEVRQPCVLAITEHPSEQTIEPDTTIDLTGAAAGSGVITYQWYASTPGSPWVAVPDATSERLSMPLSQSTYFYLRATNGCASLDTNTVLITVLPRCTQLRITQHPEEKADLVATQVTLVAAAEGTDAVWEWLSSADGVNYTVVPGESDPELDVDVLEGARWYVARATNRCSVAQTAAAKVSPIACESPRILSDPASQTITSGEPATLAAPASGTGLTYEWYAATRLGNWTRVDGATTATIHPRPSETTYYYAHVTTPCGFASSDYAVVTVLPSTPCSGPPTIHGQPVEWTISHGATATLTVVTGGATAFQWYASDDQGNFVEVDGGNGGSIQVSPPATTYYMVRVANACGSIDSTIVAVHVTAACVQPKIQFITDVVHFMPGDEVMIQALAEGTNLHYAWYKSDPAGADAVLIKSGSESFVLDKPQGDKAFYWVVVTNSCGFAQSGYANALSLKRCVAPIIDGIIPVEQTIDDGAFASMTLLARAQTEMHFQWYVTDFGSLAWAPIADSDRTTIEVRPHRDTWYEADVIVECGTVRSTTATVRVRQ